MVGLGREDIQYRILTSLGQSQVRRIMCSNRPFRKSKILNIGLVVRLFGLLGCPDYITLNCCSFLRPLAPVVIFARILTNFFIVKQAISRVSHRHFERANRKIQGRQNNMKLLIYR